MSSHADGFEYPHKGVKFLSWAFAKAWAEYVVNGPVELQHLYNIANQKGTFKTGKRAKAPFPRLYPVERTSYEVWLYGFAKKE